MKPPVFTPLLDRLTDHREDANMAASATGQLLAELRTELRAKLRRKRMFLRPPAYFGYPFNTWSDPGALEELSQDAFVYVFVTRLTNVRARALKTPGDAEPRNIDGLVRRLIDQFLFENQRANDPVGYNVYVCVEGAVMLVCRGGQWTLRPTSVKPTKLSTLEFAGDAGGPPSEAIVAVLSTHQMWPQFLKVVAHARLDPETKELGSSTFSSIILTLPDHGHRVVWFAELDDAAKQAARAAVGRVMLPYDSDSAESDLAELAKRVFEDLVHLGARTDARADRREELQAAIASSGASAAVRARRLRVLDELLPGLVEGYSFAELAKRVQTDARRFGEDVKVIMAFADKIVEGESRKPEPTAGGAH